MFKHSAIIFAVLFVVALTEAAGRGKAPARASSPQKPDGTNNPHPPSGTYTGPKGIHRSTSPDGTQRFVNYGATGQQVGYTRHAGGATSTDNLHKPISGDVSNSPPRHGRPSSPKEASTSGRRGGK